MTIELTEVECDDIAMALGFVLHAALRRNEYDHANRIAKLCNKIKTDDDMQRIMKLTKEAIDVAGDMIKR